MSATPYYLQVDETKKSNLVKSVLVGLLLFSAVGVANSQQSSADKCWLVTVPYTTFSLERCGLIKQKYDSLLSDKSGNTNILLIRSIGYVNKRYAYLISIEAASQATKISYLTADSLIFLKKQGRLKADFHETLDSSFNNFFMSTCSKPGSHEQSILLITNGLKKIRIEYDSYDGNMFEVLKTHTAYSYLNKAYSLIREVFKDVFFHL